MTAILANGELTRWFFAVSGIAPQWPNDPAIRRWSPDPLFMPLIPAATPGIAQLTTGGTNSQPDYTLMTGGGNSWTSYLAPGSYQHIWVDGRTLIRPDPASVTGYIPAVNSFQFGENPAPRSYQIKGGDYLHWRNFHGGGHKQTSIGQRVQHYVEGFRFEAKVQVTATTTGTGASRTFTINSMPYSTQSYASQTVLDSAGNLIGYLSSGSGTSWTLTLYEETTWANQTSATFYLLYPDGDAVYFAGNNAGGPSPSGTAQAVIVDDLHGTNLDPRKITGDASTGLNILIPTSITQTGTNTVTVVLPGAFGGRAKAWGQFTGSITTSVLTVTAVAQGGIDEGMFVYGPGVPAGAYVSSRGTGTGGTGTYNLSVSLSTPVSSTTLTASAAEFKIIGSKIAGTRSDLNNGFNTTFDFVSYDNATSTLVLTYSNSTMMQSKPATSTVADSRGSGAATGFIIAMSRTPGEHADPLQVDKDKLYGGLRIDSMTTRANYMQQFIANNSSVSDFPIQASRIDSEADINITPVQDLSTEWVRAGTSAAQTSVREYYQLHALLRPGQSIGGSAFPSSNNGEGGEVVTSTVDGVSKPAVRWSGRSNFYGIGTNSAAPAGVHYGYAGRATKHQGWDYPLTTYEGERKPVSADLTAVKFVDLADAEQATTITLSNDAVADQVLGRFKLEHALPGGFHIVDGYLSVSGGFGTKRLKTYGNRLLRGTAMLPPAGTYTGGLTLLAMAQVNFKATISGATMTVGADGVITGYLAEGQTIRGPGISGTVTISSAPAGGREGSYTLSTAPGDQASAVNLLATSPAQLTKTFNVTVTEGTFGTPSGAFARTWRGSAFSAAGGSSATLFSGSPVSIGTAVADRIVLIKLVSRAGADRPPTSVTVTPDAGSPVVATLVKETKNASSGSNFSVASIYQALVTTGTTATVTVAFGGTVHVVGVGIVTYVGAKRALSGGNILPFDTAEGKANTNIGSSTTIHELAGGYVEAVQFFSSATSSGHGMMAHASQLIGSTADNAAVSNTVSGTSITWTGVADDRAVEDMINNGSGATAMAVAVFAPV